MTSTLTNKIISVVKEALDVAESHWKEKGDFLTEHLRAGTACFASDARMPSKIPNHPFVHDGKVIEDTFIALVADMRNSTKHMLEAVSEKRSDCKIQRLQRIYYETSALLPALNETIKFHDGSVTEYLGDGVLALFHKKEDNDLYKTRKAALDIIGQMRNIINVELADRYKLPSINLGVGMALSNCFVTLVGSSDNKQPKIFGQNVYRATKLAYGTNEVYIDEELKCAWPKSPGGKMTFIFKRGTKRGVDGYLIPARKHLTAT